MALLAWPKARDLHKETLACVEVGPLAWDARTNAYWLAYCRRLHREIGRGDRINWDAPASECLIALAGAMQTRLTA